jgi:RNA polymerase-binding transcription factor DksA
MTAISHRAALAHALRAVETRLQGLGAPQPNDRHGDVADVQASREQHESHVLGLAELTERRRLILEALDKIGTAAEGRCEDCGQPIPGKRLAVMPWAIRDALCQGKAEQAAARDVTEPPVKKPFHLRDRSKGSADR